ncbi:FAD/NAD(P)-binding oxidoreductase [Nocardioides psychrotolerans]|uniref:Assimilatory nitrate reductase electron transfer subunit/nitrite reductase (NADH) large subunit n=1 Tax=Nocardioides psychrotolerans TaxID=1005945 RepID=A0A1I3DV46_9ACTN|nr:FAD-dependent oxidoreductase [Nocardioides psychrotolerans]GEP39249.1 FAD/NAD(P)-binding oxidoreductase [Nocardioides psychrotolerans]SFH90429.1 assimilatory nitrate reductase electron transfer subunit/nitrite reductase (NADH) large subunit [Nocardioides psychrotolerans]
MSARRVVVVGNGMAATRLVEELVSTGRGGPAQALHLTVLGDEDHPAYNRILLSAVLEGTYRLDALTLRAPEWYAEHGVDLRLGARVLGVDRERRDVMLVDGTVLPYDRLVLATGSIPSLPPIRGLVRLDGRLHEAVHAFRSLDDCLRLMEAIRPDQRAVVVGGGLLGLQVARALSVRGLDVEIVEGGEHLLRSQVGGPAGQVLARDLRRLGTTVYTGARAVRLSDTPSTSGGEGAVGLRLDNGYTLDTDLVVLTAGGRPSTALARGADLEVRRGIVVDDHLASVTDPDVFAIGDCAEHDGRTTGFVGPAWEQAALLARRLTDPDADATYTGSRSVARLRATGLDVAVLGDPERATADGGEVVEVTNPIVGSHRKLVLRDGVIVAATLVGDLSRIGLITQYFDHGTRLAGTEPAALLMGDRMAPPARLADDAEICACAGVSAGRIRACSSLDEVRATTRATTGCGGCSSSVAQVLASRPALTAAP